MKRKQIMLLHIIFWAVMLFTIGLESVPSFGKIPVNTILLDNFIYAVSFISLFYIFYFYVSKKHLSKRNIAYLIIFGLLFTLIFTVPVTAVFIYFIHKEVFDLNRNEFLFNFRTYYFGFFETNFLFVIAGSLLKTALLWYDNVMKQKEMEKQTVSNELALLRSQINPQFLFNTLTSIKSLIELHPEKAIYGIENLSEIMSYMLYESSADKVLLGDEIDHINNYLNLQRVRYNKDFINFRVTGNTNGLLVPPMIFMPFIESAFNYGEVLSQIQAIKITLDVKTPDIFFEVINFRKENTNPDLSNDDFNLNIIRRRLDLLFEKKYKLEAINEDNKFIVKLTLSLL
jgi:two-component system, LytTR family, sensor kinase